MSTLPLPPETARARADRVGPGRARQQAPAPAALLAWLALALLLLLVTACSSAPAAPAARAGPPAAAGADLQTAQHAYAILLQRSVDPPAPPALLRGALDGVAQSVAQAGVVLPLVETPQFTGDAARDWELFVGAFDGAAGRYSSKLPPGRLVYAAVRGMATAVGDCHTSFLDPSQLAEQVRWLEGDTKFGGIGASLRKSRLSDPLVVWRVFENTPAARAGLRPGDVVRAVDGRDVTDLGVEGAVAIIRGKPGTTVRLTIQRYGEPAPLEVEIVRAEVTPPVVEAAMLQGGVGYVRIYSFPEGVPGQVAQALAALDRAGARAWVIDLRNNGGGSLQAETKVASQLVRDGLLFYLWDREGKRTEFRTDGSYRGRVPPTVVMVNEGTASGGELLAATLQEHGVARLVGAQTAGCVGTAQSFRLPDGSGLQVTVGKVLMGGSSRVLNRVGVSPDVEVPMSLQDLVEGRDPQLAAALVELGAL